ncbi:MAG: antitoxin Xre-like helix-turn-helix domain-containing protein, partial [Gammaproteobacteria bacterium]
MQPMSDITERPAFDGRRARAERSWLTELGVDAQAATLTYRRAEGIEDFVHQVHHATPLQLIDAERKGIPGRFLKDLSRRMDIPAARMFAMIGVPKATAEKKAASDETIGGSGGQAALGIVRLLGIAQAIVANSTSP